MKRLAEVAYLGDVLIEGVYRLDEAIADIERHYDRVASAGIVPLTAGGDHSTTLPIMRAPARAHGGLPVSSTSEFSALPESSFSSEISGNRVDRGGGLV